MQPVVILDTNALYGRKPLSQAYSVRLLALAESGHVRLIVPEVVLLELSRQWHEEAQEKSTEALTAVKKLNESLVEFDLGQVEIDTPTPGRTAFYAHAENLFRSKRVEIPPPPEVSIRDLLSKEIDVRKPFDRQGTGFRDALIWETVRELCGNLGDPSTPVVFVTSNHTDFCSKKGGGLHPDLRQDLTASQALDVVPSLHHLLEHDAVAPIAEAFRVLEDSFTPERIEELVDSAIADLHGVDVEEALGVYIGDGMYEVPISTGLSSPAFEEIMFEGDTISSEIYKAGDELTIRVTVDADCTFDGYVDKSDYFLHDDTSGFSALEDWNDHVFRASVRGRLRFKFSASFTDATTDDIVLSLDEAEEI